ncbi:hypothetical protein HS088_TW14G01040 [Tripterygium wilfordii]|uniref:Major pollen allergen Ole e 6-like n=1 Tax=Tripterygium wilfordii TaxID=458696 RepID=A0A7J7CS05_TRIWF|nr:hypothetical protein HS088_TW14G01040 [Tripterygium wilfordii]
MANKLAALLVLCLVLVAAVGVPKANADEFADCFNSCEKECKTEGNGHTTCEMKCDTDCSDKAFAAKLNIKIP